MYKVAKIVKVVDVYHRRSPLVQGGLEPVGVTQDSFFYVGGKNRAWYTLPEKISVVSA